MRTHFVRTLLWISVVLLTTSPLSLSAQRHAAEALQAPRPRVAKKPQAPKPEPPPVAAVEPIAAAAAAAAAERYEAEERYRHLSATLEELQATLEAQHNRIDSLVSELKGLREEDTRADAHQVSHAEIKELVERLREADQKREADRKLILEEIAKLAKAPAPPEEPTRPEPLACEQLQALVDKAVQVTLRKFADKKLTTNQLALTLVDLRHPEHPVQASFRGEEQIYPASVVKLFYLVAAEHWLEDGELEDTAELRRALRDMIADSSNEATHYILDLLTGTTSGPELPPAELAQWHDKRNVVNRYFASLGYANINVNKKPWCEGPYGRESQAIKAYQPNRNLLTTDATARLLAEIVTGKAVSPKRAAEMMDLLQRDPAAKTGDPDDQAKFAGSALPSGAKLWSKAGWTSQTRHDAAYIELPNGAKFVLVVFTVDHANEREIIPTVARVVIEGMSAATDRVSAVAR
ncbi:MAG: serine hydrolase [Verrucomicrobia bacterium]|nr:serine hydrolase [Verrucomicrobiota bacterium]